ncbi:MAG TPA: hypothetical protein VHU80_14715 [Polyangiaceae bacterium]|nr:hypothetical protein [Polyangiaceae bacterium]
MTPRVCAAAPGIAAGPDIDAEGGATDISGVDDGIAVPIPGTAEVFVRGTVPDPVIGAAFGGVPVFVSAGAAVPIAVGAGTPFGVVDDAPAGVVAGLPAIASIACGGRGGITAMGPKIGDQVTYAAVGVGAAVKLPAAAARAGSGSALFEYHDTVLLPVVLGSVLFEYQTFCCPAAGSAALFEYQLFWAVAAGGAALFEYHELV